MDRTRPFIGHNFLIYFGQLVVHDIERDSIDTAWKWMSRMVGQFYFDPEEA
jgi:hypothetical protein